MTWVVEVPVPFGYSIGCADIRVTFSDGTEKDCLQKIYQVGPVVCAAFAGSIRIGFALQRISQLLNNVEPGRVGSRPSRSMVAHGALDVWNRMPGNEQRPWPAHPSDDTLLRTPYCGHLRWAYTPYTLSGSRTFYEIQYRYLSMSRGSAETAIQLIRGNDSAYSVHSSATLDDSPANAEKYWSFHHNVPGCPHAYAPDALLRLEPVYFSISSGRGCG